MTVSSFEEITTNKPEKSPACTAEENTPAAIAMAASLFVIMAAVHKRKYRIIDFKRLKDGIPARVATIEYDPNRSSRIALLHYVDGEKRYIIAPAGLQVGDVIYSGPDADIKTGNALPLANIPVGTLVHNIELHPGRGGQICRSAGVSAQLMAKEGKYAMLRLPSGEVRKIPSYLPRYHRCCW